MFQALIEHTGHKYLFGGNDGYDLSVNERMSVLDAFRQRPPYRPDYLFQIFLSGLPEPLTLKTLSLP
jgi:hypothetical protein